jgi:hypothetical protein
MMLVEGVSTRAELVRVVPDYLVAEIVLVKYFIEGSLEVVTHCPIYMDVQSPVAG